MRYRGLLALASASLMFVAACSGSSGASDQPDSRQKKPTPQAKIAVRPADGKDAVRPDQKVTVSVRQGSVKKVAVQGTRTTSEDGEKKTTEVTVKGKTTAQGTKWRSSEPLVPGAKYKVSATAVDANGLTTKVTSSFSTLEAERVLHAGIAPLDGETVGVGMPIILYLSEPVADKHKKDVERRLKLTMSEPVEGAWHWRDDETLQFRPREYWPAGQHVKLETNFTGVKAGEGLWGDQSRTIEFDVGERHVSQVNAKAHTMTVRRGGEVVRKFDISAGSAEHPSSSGTMVAKAKVGDMVMNPPNIPKSSPDYYETPTKWNVRITDSGQFVHGAPWSVDAQGERNVSHGCINMSLDHAKWFYNFTQRGDIIKVKGTQRDLQRRNGWTAWNMSWSKWVEGSALNRSINSSA